MKNGKHDLAVVFTKIESAAGKVDEVAKGILASIKEQDCTTLEHFNEMVSDAFQRNGWSQKQGRPSEGSTERPAPDAVKLYVSTARAAYRMKINLLEFETMGALRTAIRNARSSGNGNGTGKREARPPELKGVHVSRDGSLTGALWHDAVVVWEHLPIDAQQEFEKQVRRLLNRFRKKAPAELAKSA